MFKLMMPILILAMGSSSVMAGATQLTHNSRANCGNNESISWDASTKRNLSVSSYHAKPGVDHYATTGGFLNGVRRAGAVHWGTHDAGNNWYVRGTHWEKLSNRTTRASTYATGCNISEGWY